MAQSGNKLETAAYTNLVVLANLKSHNASEVDAIVMGTQSVEQRISRSVIEEKLKSAQIEAEGSQLARGVSSIAGIVVFW